MLKAGVIGCGFIGADSPDSHMKGYQECPDIILMALCDSDLTRIPYPERGEYEEYTDYMQMVISMQTVLSEKLDIVSVCTPTKTHARIVTDIAPYVKAINCEKPIAESVADADEMIRVCKEYGVILQVNHQRRFSQPVFRWSRGYVHNGTHVVDFLRQIGALGKVRLEYIDTQDYIFELDIHTNPAKNRLTLRGIEHLITCVKEGRESISSGWEARETLRLLLKEGINDY